MSLTSNGFERPRLPEIKATYDQLFTDALGPVNTAPDAVVGQVIGVFSAAMDDVYELLQNTYDSMYPSTASGVSLDLAVSYVGMERKAARATVVTAACYGADGAVLLAGSIARSAGTQFLADTDILITKSAVLDVSIRIDQSTPGVYQLVVGGELIAYTAEDGATVQSIAAGIATMTPDGYAGSSSDDTVRIMASDGKSYFPVSTDSKMTIVKIGSPGVFTCDELGAVAVPVGSLSEIVTATVGWDSIANLAIGEIGADTESDEDLRSRYNTSISVAGAATVNAITSRILDDVDGVTRCRVYENTSAFISDDGMPAHSFDAVVHGGSDSDVANTIWSAKPAGIATDGNVSVLITDDFGDRHEIKFSRPVDVYAWVKVTIQRFNTEEPQVFNVANAVIDEVYNYAVSEFSVGDDIVTQKLYYPIFEKVTGIGQVLVEVALTSTPSGTTPTYTTENLTIGRAQFPVFDKTRITVLGV